MPTVEEGGSQGAICDVTAGTPGEVLQAELAGGQTAVDPVGGFHVGLEGVLGDVGQARGLLGGFGFVFVGAAAWGVQGLL